MTRGGCPVPGPFTGHALAAGEGVIAGDLGLVPGGTHTHLRLRRRVLDRGLAGVRIADSPPTSRRAPPDEPAQAEADLSVALAEATAALSQLDVAAWRPELAGSLAALRKPDHGTDLPPGFSPRARRLFARASVLDRVLALAAVVAPGGAVNAFEAQRRDDALRPLMSACRQALMAACNSPLEP